MVSSNSSLSARRLYVFCATTVLVLDVCFAAWRWTEHAGPHPLALPFIVVLIVAAGGVVLVGMGTKADRSLPGREGCFRSLFDANLIGVGFWTFDGRVHDANDELLRIFGIARSELPEWRWATADTPTGQLVDAWSRESLRRTGRCAPYGKECIRADGSHVWVDVAPAVIEGSDLNVVFVRDMTERVQANRSLERAHQILIERLARLEGAESEELVRERAQVEVLAQRVAAANEELETFSYSVSHDLRAPLRAIDGFSRELELSSGDSLDEQGRRYLAKIRAATRRMAQLIDDLLDLARLSRKPMRRTAADVTAIAQEVAAELGAPWVDVAPGLWVDGDVHLVRVVLQNLIGNAVKFSAPRETPRVEVFAAGDGVIAVRDNGVGFDMAYAEKLFTPFQRLHPSSDFEGTGIGLALVHRIVQRHGGTLRAESAPGQGATFFFALGDSQ
jgi:PAS domain S-box-containing protein